MTEEAMKEIENADIVIITAGAGMGVDSGLPDFRGNEGFWKAYPALKNKNIDFVSIANPKQFKQFSKIAWGFYGHRFDLYKNTTPHVGFDALKELVKHKKDYFIVTSNVDGQFQKAGFDKNKIYEVHGRINKFQCTSCNKPSWDAPENTKFDVDPETFEMKGEIPKCDCGADARPNIMMFNDFGFDSTETSKQEKAFNKFMHKYDKGSDKIVVIEVGAGTAIPTIRNIGENIQDKVENARLVRINPRESEGPKGTISISKGGVEALTKIIPKEIKKVFFIKP